MRFFILTLSLIFHYGIYAQKELVGIWDLQFRGTSQNVQFDINKPSIVISAPGSSGIKVNFQTANDSLNKKMSVTSYDVFKNSWLQIKNKKKFKRNDVTIINGQFLNEECQGSYYINHEKKEIQFDVISSTTKKITSSATFSYQIQSDQFILTSVENPDFCKIYKRR